jgi:hypothetical protein
MVKIHFSIFSTLSEGTQNKVIQTHGYPRAVALFLFLRPAYQQLDRMEDHVIWATEDTLEKCRQMYISECNMSAIAVSILSEENLTRLYL